MGYVWELLLKPFNLSDTIKFLNKVPPMKLIVDHIAKPYIADKKID